MKCCTARRSRATKPRISKSTGTVTRRLFSLGADSSDYLLERVRQELKIQKPEDWYNVKRRDLIAAGGTSLLVNDQSFLNLLRKLHPDHKWHPWEFCQVPQSWWLDSANQRQFLDYLGEKLGYKTLEDYYQLTIPVIRLNKGQRLVNIHGGSLVNILQHAYPEHVWLPWKFRAVPHRWWYDVSNRRKFLEWLRSTRNYSMDDMYKLTKQEIDEAGGSYGLRHTKHNIALFVMDAYPEHRWLPWKFSSAPPKFWAVPSNRLWFLEWLREHLQLKSLSDFYSLPVEAITQHGGNMLLQLYGYKIRDLLQDVYPEHEWETWRFHKAPAAFWRTPSPQDAQNAISNTQLASFLKAVARIYGINENRLEDWYSVSPNLLGWGVMRVLRPFGGIIGALRAAFPHHVWEEERFRVHRAAEQDMLRNCLKNLYQHYDISRSNLQIASRPGAPLELDIFVKEMNLAVEYQGDRHYFDVSLYGEVLHFSAWDAAKAVLCAMRGVHLVEVPYWWDRSMNSLQLSISAFVQAHPTSIASKVTYAHKPPKRHRITLRQVRARFAVVV